MPPERSQKPPLEPIKVSQATWDSMNDCQPDPPTWLDELEVHELQDSAITKSLAEMFQESVSSTGTWTRCLLIQVNEKEVSVNLWWYGKLRTGFSILEKPANEESINKTSVNEKSVNKQSVNEQSVNKKSVNGKPIKERSVNEQSVDETLVDEDPANEKMSDMSSHVPRVAYYSVQDISTKGFHTLLHRNGTRKLIEHGSGPYGGFPASALRDLNTQVTYQVISNRWDRKLKFAVPHSGWFHDLGKIMFLWRHVILDGKESLILEAWNRQLAKIERKGSKVPGSKRWAAENSIELWLDTVAMDAAGISEAVVVASSLMMLRSEIVRGLSIAAWIRDRQITVRDEREEWIRF